MEWGFFEVFAAGLAGFYSLVKSYGLAIILLTLLVRVVLLPLSIKQTRSMREMAVIQPEIKKIQAKHKGDRQKLNEEMMKLYKEHGVNPLGGCLPLLMQFPVLIALFYVIRNPLAYMSSDWSLFHALRETPLAVNRFLGLRLDCYPSKVLSGDASEAIPNVDCSSGGLLPFLPYLVMIMLMGFTTYYQQKQMQASRPGDSPQAAQMQMFARIMPVMLMLFAFNFPTGVVLYWLTTNVWTIVQQRIILKAAPLPTPGSAPKGKAKTGAPPTSTRSTRSKPAGRQDRADTPAKDAAEPGAQPLAARSRPHPSSKKKKKRR